MPGDRPIRIAGAGPSGLAAAIALARAGRNVEVHEAKADVGLRFIGDHQIIEGSSEPEPVPRVAYESRGQVLIVGPADAALHWAQALSAELAVTVLATGRATGK